MAAGQGFKEFTTGEVLTAGDVNGYLMQGVLVFASAAARNAAITSPQEGQFAFTKDTNGLWYYDGAAWVASGATGDIEGVTAGVGISGGGTSGTVTVTNSMATAITAAGDLVKGTGSGTFDVLPIGSTGQILTVAGGTASWASASGGGSNWSLFGSASLTASQTVTISGISGKDKIMVLLANASSATASSQISLRLNATTTGYYYAGTSQAYISTYAAGNFEGVYTSNYANIDIGYMGSNAASSVSGGATFSGCNSSGLKQFTSVGGGNAASSSVNQYFWTSQGYWDNSATVSSVSARSSVGNFDNGTMYVYTSVS